MADDRPAFELEATHDRAELAALFAELAAALETDRPARIAVDEGTASIAFPDAIDLDLEIEADAEEVELELELEWTAPTDGASVRLEDAELPPEGVTAADVGSDDQAPDPAASTMSAGASVDDVDAETGDDGTAPDDATGAGRTARFEVYRDRGGEWRWRLVHWNGNIVADSGEGYASRYNATRAITSVTQSASTARIEHVEE